MRWLIIGLKSIKIIAKNTNVKKPILKQYWEIFVFIEVSMKITVFPLKKNLKQT